MNIENAGVITFILTAVTLLLNLPFGYLRSKTKKFSRMWFLYIHLPIPFIFALRTLAGIGYIAIPVFIAGAVAGQLLGGRMNPARIS